jgi:hypothetical protein
MLDSVIALRPARFSAISARARRPCRAIGLPRARRDFHRRIHHPSYATGGKARAVAILECHPLHCGPLWGLRILCRLLGLPSFWTLTMRVPFVRRLLSTPLTRVLVVLARLPIFIGPTIFARAMPACHSLRHLCRAQILLADVMHPLGIGLTHPNGVPLCHDVLGALRLLSVVVGVSRRGMGAAAPARPALVHVIARRIATDIAIHFRRFVILRAMNPDN